MQRGLRQFNVHKRPGLEKEYVGIKVAMDLEEKIKKLEHMSGVEALELFPEFRSRKDVLRALGYINEEETAELKGRAAVNVTTNER